MFNASVKQDYIKYNPNNNQRFSKVMTNYFNRAEESEKRFKKDLSQFTSSEIMAMYKSFCTYSLSMLVVINNQFMNYTNWYMANVENKDNQNHYKEMRDDILLECIAYAAYKSNILTREQLLDMIKDFANPYEQFLYLALFEGVKGDQMSDFYDLKMEDFDRKKKKLSLPGRKIDVSAELIHYAEDSSDEYQMYNIDGNPVTRGQFLEEDKRVIKCSKSVGFEAEKKDRVRIVYRMMRKTKRYDFVPKTLSISALIESGRIDWIRNKMIEKGQDAEQIIRELKPQIDNQYGAIPSVPKWLMKYEKYCKG